MTDNRKDEILMADINRFIIGGTIPKFENAIRKFNMEDENNARICIKVSSETRTKDANGYIKKDLHDLVAFRSVAQRFDKFAVPGAGFTFEGYITPSTPRIQNGAQVVDAEGKKVYNPPSLVFIDFHPNKNYAPAPSSTGNNTKTSAAVADPMNYDFGTGTSAGNSSGGSSDGFDFGGDFDFGGTEVSKDSYPF